MMCEIAARLAGAKELIFPMANRKDFDELADFIREGLTVHFVDWYQQVFDICFEYPVSSICSSFLPSSILIMVLVYAFQQHDEKVVTLVVPAMPEAESIAETAAAVKTPDAEPTQIPIPSSTPPPPAAVITPAVPAA
jgi:hypothetical protein